MLKAFASRVGLVVAAPALCLVPSELPGQQPIACGDVVPRVLAAGQQDRFTFTAMGGETVSITLDDDVRDLSTVFDLFDPNGKEVVEPGAAAGKGRGNGIHDIVLPGVAGTYTLRVRDGNAEYGGAYALSFERLFPMNTQCPEEDLLCGERAVRCLREAAQDVLNFEASGGETVSITLDDDVSELGTVFDLFDPNGQEVVEPGGAVVRGRGNGIHDIVLPGVEGTYTLRVRDGSSEYGGRYHVTFTSLFGMCDCNANGTADSDDIGALRSADANRNGVPDECELSGFIRGDANGDGSINLTDAVFLLNYLFVSGPEPPCLDAADVNDSGQIDLGTGVYLLNFLFLGGPSPLLPHPLCGPDPTCDLLDCEVSFVRGEHCAQ
jgi:hypothetical protein